MNNKSKRVRIFTLCFAILYIILVLAPLIHVYPSLPQGYKGVDPEIVNGLLTASSILFGFAMLPLGKKRMDKLFLLMIIGDLTLLGFCGLTLFQFAIGYNDGLPSLIVAIASLNANVTTSLYRHILSVE